MNRWFAHIAILLVVVVLSPAVKASEPARLFMEGVDAYEKQDYGKAVGAFLSIAENGVRNGELYYNLGNAYLKNGDLGRALLWYERAVRLIPGDPDVTFNRDYALSLTKDAAPEEEGNAARVLFFWNYLLSAQTIQILALVLNAIFWLMLGITYHYNKRMIRVFLPIVFFALLFFSMTAGFNIYRDARSNTAVILPAEVSVRSGFGDNATELFVLHAGSRVTIQKTRTGHYQIQYSRDKLGWIKAGDAELI